MCGTHREKDRHRNETATDDNSGIENWQKENNRLSCAHQNNTYTKISAQVYCASMTSIEMLTNTHIYIYIYKHKTKFILSN